MNEEHPPHSGLLCTASPGILALAMPWEVSKDGWLKPAHSLDSPKLPIWVLAKLLSLAVNDSISTESDHWSFLLDYPIGRLMHLHLANGIGQPESTQGWVFKWTHAENDSVNILIPWQQKPDLMFFLLQRSHSEDALEREGSSSVRGQESSPPPTSASCKSFLSFRKQQK